MKELFHRYLGHNFGLKAISLGLALGLWLAVSGQSPAEVAVEVPIEFHNIPANLEIGSESVPRAQIRLRGPEREVRALKPSDVRAEVDLTGVMSGQRTFDLSQNMHYPRGLDARVIPNYVQLTFDTRLTRQVEVHPRVNGAFASQYSIERLRAIPPVVTISGPRKRVEAIDAAITDPVDASGTVNEATFVTQAYVSDPLVRVVNPVEIRVIVTMQKAAPGGATAPQKP
jgi:YbbR domain-containing protein